MKILLTSLLSLFFLWAPELQAQVPVGDPLRNLPVQDAGRLKPFDTFARESLQLIYGRRTFQDRAPVDVVMTWMLIPKHWDNVDFVQVRHSGLKEALKLPESESLFAPKELFLNERVGLLFQELRSKRERQEKLNPYYQAVQRLENQMTLYHAIKLGRAIRVAPPKEGTTWISVAELSGSLQEEFQDITRTFVKAVTAASKREKDELAGFRGKLNEQVKDFRTEAQAQRPELYPSMTKIRVETHYNTFDPFLWSWILYLIGLVTLGISWVNGSTKLYRFSWFAAILGLAFHTYGMGIRTYITGRAPVSNMYETVVWVPWGTVVIAMIMEKIYKNRMVLIGAQIVAVLCLILTDLAPTVLDGTLQPLEPVLRSNFWLTTHVLIITLSYAAFFLAFILGDMMLVYYLIDEKKHAKKLRDAAQSIYRSIQVGVVLLAAGIILGGIWADYSWGRFWGWDPKETWALIALLGYVAVLHGRLVGWVKNFALAASSVLAFSLVIMAWYGVNFVLGAGLHSYGFGAGGVEYVSAFVALHVLFVAYVATVRQSRLKASA